MKYKPCLVIRCIVLDVENIENIVLKNIKLPIMAAWPDAQVYLEGSESYWKFPECKDIIYGFYHSSRYLIPALIKLFKVTWEYEEDMAHLVSTDEHFLDQEAIWSKNCYPEEMFVHPAVEWVHIYTWPESAS